MPHAGESPGLTRGGQALAPLHGLLELSRLTRRQPTAQEVLHAIASTVADALGFAVAAVSVHRPDADAYEVVAVHGDSEARGRLLGRVTAADAWTPLLEPRFRRHGAYFVPAGGGGNDTGAASSPAAWRPGDALFAPLDGLGGRRHGIIAVDTPISGERPDEHVLEVLGALAAHAALALDSTLQVAALEGALARNQAVIASALDAVVAVDAHDRVIEFNPAAERTFGYRSQEVLGRRGVELFAPPEVRNAYSRNLRRLRDDPRSHLLGRRIDTTAMRRGGETFPAELTVTRVDEGEEPAFYAFVRDISARRRSEEQLAYLAYHDALTGLPNRLMVEQQLDLALARARRSGGAAALMFVDLDDFKEVNDRLGHAAGDRLLAAVATRLRAVLRGSDVLARQGGDEFLVLLDDLGEEAALAAESVAAKLLDALREPITVAGTEIRTGASIGISLYPADASDTEALLRHADAAMYHAKAAGGGRLSFHQRLGGGPRRTSIPGRLRTAVASDELELHYQPVRRLSHPHHILAVEALLRWHHPDQGLLGPESFMTLADQTSTGDELLDWSVGEACRQAREWLRSGLQPAIGLNVSAQQLLSPGFVSRFLARVTDAGLHADRFLVELPESAWTADSAQTRSVIDDLRATGVCLVLDHFGAGRLTLARLLDLGFDLIKLGAPLLRDVPADPASTRLLEAVFSLITACGAEALADGVRTPEQAEVLVAHRVTAGQGEWLAPPAPGAQLTPLLERSLVPWTPPRRPPAC